MLLEGIKKTVIEVDYNDVDRAIDKYFGIGYGTEYPGYESVAVEEWNNYQDKEIQIDGILDKYDQEKLDYFLANKDKANKHPGVRIMLNYLASIGEIEKGDYLISVFW